MMIRLRTSSTADSSVCFRRTNKGRRHCTLERQAGNRHSPAGLVSDLTRGVRSAYRDLLQQVRARTGRATLRTHCPHPGAVGRGETDDHGRRAVEPGIVHQLEREHAAVLPGDLVEAL